MRSITAVGVSQTMTTDLSNIQFRPAEKSDCREIASLYSISSDGVADYIWTKLSVNGVMNEKTQYSVTKIAQ
jgi:hypothetical protein